METSRKVRVGKGINRITVVESKPGAGREVAVAYRKRQGRRKKGLRELRPLEKMTRRLARGYAAAADEYLKLHERANRKKKDGWLRDASINVLRADRKGLRKMKLGRWV